MEPVEPVGWPPPVVGTLEDRYVARVDGASLRPSLRPRTCWADDYIFFAEVVPGDMSVREDGTVQSVTVDHRRSIITVNTNQWPEAPGL